MTDANTDKQSSHVLDDNIVACKLSINVKDTNTESEKNIGRADCNAIKTISKNEKHCVYNSNIEDWAASGAPLLS